jgi:hypothetical protein
VVQLHVNNVLLVNIKAMLARRVAIVVSLVVIPWLLPPYVLDVLLVNMRMPCLVLVPSV